MLERFYGPQPVAVKKTRDYKGESLTVTQMLTVDGQIPWRVVAACVSTADANRKLHSEDILRVLIESTVAASSFGLEEPGAFDKITDPDFGWFLYDWLGGPDVIDHVNRVNDPGYLGKLSGLPPAATAPQA